MFDENLIATLEVSLRETRNAQHRLMSRLREVELESERLREEIQALENSASKTEAAIDSILVTLRSSASPTRSSPTTMRIDDEYDRVPARQREDRPSKGITELPFRSNKVSYISQNRHVPLRTNNTEPISYRFADRTITQACTLLLREAGQPLHVNELYNLLVAGGMEFKGNNPTISIAVSLNRNRRFRKVDPGTFDLVMREASRKAS